MMKSVLTHAGATLLLLSVAACGATPNPLSEVSNDAASMPSLGSAAGFAVLGASTVTCTNASDVTGDVGVAPGTAITGFNPDCTITGSIHAGDAVASQAHNDLVTSYGSLAAVACEHNLTGQDLGGQTLAPGVYCFDSSVGITGDLTLDGGGDANAVWIFQVGSTITTGSNASVIMSGSGEACNVFWQVGSSATIGVGTQMKGNILAYASITLVSGSNLDGRALALNAAVTMDHNVVTAGCMNSGNPGSGSENPSCRGKDKITGGGWIKPSGSKKTFAVQGQIKNGDFKGGLRFNDHSANVKVKSQSVTSYIKLDDTTRRIQGTAKVNGVPGFTWSVDVSDKGEPGTNDTFSLALSNGYAVSGVLQGGNIQLHTRQGNCDGNDDGGPEDGDEDDGDSDDEEDDDQGGNGGGHGGNGHHCNRN